MFGKKRYTRKSIERAINYIKANYELIEVENCKLLYNYKCHVNSVQYMKENGGEIISCFQVFKDDIICHFINKLKGKYLETTQGRVGPESYTYYKIKEVKIKEFDKAIDDPLDQIKNMIFDISFTNRFLNKLYKLTPYNQF